jgi:hypothetical protein
MTPRVRMWILGSEEGMDASIAADTNAIISVGEEESCATRQRRFGWMRSWVKNVIGYSMGRRVD